MEHKLMSHREIILYYVYLLHPISVVEITAWMNVTL